MDPFDLPEGTLIRGKYAIQKLLGQGAHGDAYMCLDLLNNVYVAIKVQYLDHVTDTEGRSVTDPPLARQKICPEINTLNMLASTGCAKYGPRLYEWFFEDISGIPCAFIVEEYIAGPTLAQLARSWPRTLMPLDLIYIIIGKLIDAVTCLHHHGIIHNDIHEENVIWFSPSGNPFDTYSDVKFIDFGASTYKGIRDICPDRFIYGATEQFETVSVCRTIIHLLNLEELDSLYDDNDDLTYEQVDRYVPPSLGIFNHNVVVNIIATGIGQDHNMFRLYYIYHSSQA